MKNSSTLTVMYCPSSVKLSITVIIVPTSTTPSSHLMLAVLAPQCYLNIEFTNFTRDYPALKGVEPFSRRRP